MDVKRYDATVEYGPGWDAGASAVMDEAADGDWVEFTDYAAVEAECDRLRTERDALQRRANHLSDFVDLVVHNSLDPLTREKAKLARETDAAMCAGLLPKENDDAR